MIYFSCTFTGHNSNPRNRPFGSSPASPKTPTKISRPSYITGDRSANLVAGPHSHECGWRDAGVGSGPPQGASSLLSQRYSGFIELFALGSCSNVWCYLSALNVAMHWHRQLVSLLLSLESIMSRIYHSWRCKLILFRISKLISNNSLICNVADYRCLICC